MKTKSILLWTICLVMAFGCGNKYGKLTRRYNVASDSLLLQNKIGKWLDVDGYFFKLDEPDKPKKVYKTIFDFPAIVQRKLVEEYGHKDAKSEDLIKSISTSFKPEEKKDPDPALQFDDRTVFKKRFVATIRNKSFYPADRIWKIYIRLIKEDASTRFSNTSVIATDFETVDVGKLGYTNNSTFSTNLSAGSGVSLSDSSTNTSPNSSQSKGSSVQNKIGASVGYTNQFTMSEEVQLKQRYVKLSGSVKKNSLALYQESTSGIDLSGNIIADVELRTGDIDPTNTTPQPTFIFSNFMKGASYNDPKDIEAKEVVVVYPLIKTDIYGRIEFDAVVRRVKDKDNTIVEADDKVVFLHGLYSDTSTKNILILTKREATPSFWELSNSAGNPARIKVVSSGAEQDLRFGSMEDARNFLGWLKQKSAEVEASKGKIGKDYQIGMGEGGGSLTAAAINALSLNIVW